ncbi:hypothetical protein CRG98_040005 [Punica granatum]|uniref:Uncharacterized protein n=1 Tax=Punica granatum TaxID=22663 RepID=A0A2I0I6B7_PUNGR|nr:hypothetical protein CRG98_040005 [Punica granatum]
MRKYHILSGTLAPEIGNLAHIKSIILRNNTFSGFIPEGIGELKELEVLDLGYNNFSGPLPYKLGNNLSLSILLLDNNVLLTALSPEVYEFKIISEAQVDESLLSASLERNADSIQGQHFIHERMLAGTSPESSNSPDTRNRVRPTAATSFPIPVPFCIPDCIPSPALIPSGLSSGL